MSDFDAARTKVHLYDQIATSEFIEYFNLLPQKGNICSMEETNIWFNINMSLESIFSCTK